MRELSEVRVDIDRVDKGILDLYQERMNLATEVAEYKISIGKPVYDKNREEEKLASLSNAAKEENKQSVRELYEHIMAVSRKKQYQILAEHNMIEPLGFDEIDSIDYEGKNICYQGVEGAYSQIALKEFFKGDNYNSFHVDSWRDAMDAITNGTADYAVLPIENSSAGFIATNYDLLSEYDVTIVGEQIVKVGHALLALPGTKIEDITTVYSHAQAIMQCDGYLRNHMEWNAVAMENTAKAAKKVKEDGIKNAAAIGSTLCAKLYGLDILETPIADNQNNQTRFIIVTSKKQYVKDADKVSVTFVIKNEQGSLYHLLSHFTFNGLDMSKIESRPLKGESWSYRFFVDFTGNLQSKAVINAITGVKAEAASFRILGCYKGE